jgi:hypothetical protein
MLKFQVMKKIIGAIFIAGIIWFFFIFESPYSDFTNHGITEKDTQFIGKVIKDKPGIVENEKLIASYKKGVKKQIDEANARNRECWKNSQEFFKKSNREIYDEKNILSNLDYVFKNTLERKSGEMLYNLLLDWVDSGMVISPKRVKIIRKDLEICRPKKSLKFIDKVIDKIKDHNKKREISFDLIKKINTVLIGSQDSFINMKLALHYLARLEKLKIIKGSMNKSKSQIFIFEKECFQAVDKAKDNKELLESYKECRANLRIFSTKLKDKLKSFVFERT